MEGQGEAAADVITGGVIARAIEPTAGEAKDHAQEHGQCRNCGATVTGSYCSNCGQPTHFHRSLVSLGHDILHGVFHFEGKVWHTIPELLFRPGRLTRRYIDGERAKFVSPDGAVSVHRVPDVRGDSVHRLRGRRSKASDPLGVAEQFKENIGSQIEKLNEQIETKREQLVGARARRRRRAQEDRGRYHRADCGARGPAGHDQRRLAGHGEVRAGAGSKGQGRCRGGRAADTGRRRKRSTTPRAGSRSAVQAATENPALLAYKLKTTGYKFSWALIPLSVPFMWLLFFWRRDIHAYDHAIFVTYSISFMMLFAVIVTLLYDLGVSAWIWGTAIGIVPPLHLYKQLRGAYGISRFGAWVRLFLLTIMITFVLTLFGCDPGRDRHGAGK